MNPKTKQIISEAFYREYEWGEKDISDYGGEIKKK